MYTDKQPGYGHGSSIGQISAASSADAAAYQAKWAEHVKMEQQVKRSPEVIDEIEQLARATDLLEKTVETLLPRLQPVSNQCANDAVGAVQTAPAPVLCGIAQAIRNKRQQIDYVQEQLLRAIHALEI